MAREKEESECMLARSVLRLRPAVGNGTEPGLTCTCGQACVPVATVTL